MDPLHISLTPMGGGVNIDIDASLFIQLGLFLFLMVVLTKLVFKPFLASIEKREAQTTAARSDAEALEARAKDLEKRYRESLASVRADAASTRQSLRLEGSHARDAQVNHARQSANEAVATARDKAARQFEAGREKLLGEVETLSRLVVEKVLGRGV